MPANESIRRRRLPHWDVPGATYFVTTCLAGSIPAQGLLEIAHYRTELSQRRRPPEITEDEWASNQWKLLFARTDQWLDRTPVVRHLDDDRLAQVVVDAMYFFAGKRYDLLAYVVMPSHIHWVFTPLESWISGLDEVGAKPRERILHSLNRFTAQECNKVLGHREAFWQAESYDHWVRSPEELERIIAYVEANPVKAQLVQSPDQWPFSSAHDRPRLGVAVGRPLRREGFGT